MLRRVFASIICLLTVGVALSAWSSMAAVERQGSGPLSFLQEGQCYRIAFSIEGAPNYKILDVKEGGWIRAEVDAGTAKAQRQALWINSAQIVTLREARCSD